MDAKSGVQKKGSDLEKDLSSDKMSVKFKLWQRLILTNPADCDVGLEIVFTTDRDARKASENRKLADMVKSVGEWSLKQFLRRGIQLLRAGEKIVEALQRIEEALDLVGPRKRLRIVPRGLTLCRRESPIEEITNVGEDLNGCAAILAGVEIRETLRSIADDFAGAIGDCGQRVAKKIAGTDSIGEHDEHTLAVSGGGEK